METGNDKTNDEATSNAVKCNDGLSAENTNSVASPVAILNSGSSMETGDDKTNDEATSNAVECDNGLSAEGTNPVASPVAILNSGSSMETGDDKTNDELATSNTAECDNTEGTKSILVSNSKAIEVGAKNTPSQDKLRYISKYLVQFVPDAKPQTKGTTVQISGARVLTSEKCATIIQEREEKKRKEQEDKERKKLLREKRSKKKKKSKGRRKPWLQKRGLKLQKKEGSSRKEGSSCSKESREGSRQSQPTGK